MPAQDLVGLIDMIRRWQEQRQAGGDGSFTFPDIINLIREWMGNRETLQPPASPPTTGPAPGPRPGSPPWPPPPPQPPTGNAPPTGGPAPSSRPTPPTGNAGQAMSAGSNRARLERLFGTANQAPYRRLLR